MMNATATPAQASAPPPSARTAGRWWQQVLQAFDGLPYRACDLCSHGIDVGGIRHCVCADVVLPAAPAHVRARAAVPVHLVRSPHGACGTEARYLAFPGLDGR